jgi:hypothetical protein
MNRKNAHMIGLALSSLGALIFIASLAACGKAVPHEVIEAVEAVDRDLMQLRAAEIAPRDYGTFTKQWTTLRTRVEAEEDLIHWPWESNDLELALRHLQE